MNRIEIVGLFMALKKLCDKNDLDAVKDVIEAVLEEAQSEKSKSDGKKDDK